MDADRQDRSPDELLPEGVGPDSLADVQAVIASAKARGMEPLISFLRRRFPEASEAQVTETAEVAVEVIETVPLFLARAAQAGHEKRLDSLVEPLLDHAANYFIQPMDLIPEMTHGLAGLLDDTYLVLRILRSLEDGPKPLVEWDLEEPMQVMRHLIGEDVARRLDLIAERVMEEVLDDLNRLWEGLGTKH